MCSPTVAQSLGIVAVAVMGPPEAVLTGYESETSLPSTLHVKEPLVQVHSKGSIISCRAG